MKDKIKHWLKENWFKLTWVIIAITIAYFWFARPIIYKKYCAEKVYKEGFGSRLFDADEIYKVCLRKYGL